MSTNIIAMGVALTSVVGLVVALGGLNLLIGAIVPFLTRPKLEILKSEKGDVGFAFFYSWDEIKDPAKMDYFKIRLFNPFSKEQINDQIEIVRPLDGQDGPFVVDLDLGNAFKRIIESGCHSRATILFEIGSHQSEHFFQLHFRGDKFLNKIQEAKRTIKEAQEDVEKLVPKKENTPVYGVVPKGTVADTVPGKGPQLKLATNPSFAGSFAMGGSGDAGAVGASAAGPAQENFSVKKVWIAEGCIVCNACEDIYPEVFDVQANTCIIRPGAPLDNGLRIVEASDACPVEVIKYERA